MRIFYDFHLHTALSPCADNDMTPNNIANMAFLCGLSAIAVTDHNTAKNANAVISAAKNAGMDLIVIPGVELETAEEIHMVCLFPTLEKALEFDSYVSERMSRIINKPEIFGDQITMDEYDNETGRLETLLIAATTIDMETAIKKVNEIGGIIYPAHIDREANGILASFGFIPAELGFNIVEVSTGRDGGEFLKEKQRLLNKDYYCIQSSDAHTLAGIGEAKYFIDFPGDTVSAESIIEFLKSR